ncbi:MAG: FtsK/SpoIIIE domain-containing protein [Actinomycetota bacterium]|nr:FtsK/SpoIIIE domain-containing protein [Actinomycetota bacterium]
MDIWLRVDSPDGDVRELALEIEPDRPVSELTEAIARHLGIVVSQAEHFRLYCERPQEYLAADAPIALSGLRTGDRVSVRPFSDNGKERRGSVRGGDGGVIDMVVVGGPLAGERHRLPMGEHLIGSGRGSAVRLADPLVSRAHLRVNVDPEQLLVSDAQSRNGTFINGQPLTSERPIGLGEVVEMGGSLVTFERPESAEVTRPPVNGVIPFNRPPRITDTPQPRTYKLRAPPEDPEPPHLRWSYAAGAALMGFGLYAATGFRQPLYLGIALFSPVIVLLAYFEDRRSGRSKFRKSEAAFREELAALLEEIRGALPGEAARRRALAPDVAELADRATKLRPNLWERWRSDGDFLELRVGWGDQPAGFKWEVDRGGNEKLREEAESALSSQAWLASVPLTVPLLEKPVVGLCGPEPFVASLARWLVVQAVTLHSPDELVLVAHLPAAGLDEWSWLGWLPHVRAEGSPLQGRHVVDEAGGNELVERLLGLAQSRRAQAKQALMGSTQFRPHMLVMLHRSAHLDPSSLAALLEAGAEQGMSFIWVGGERAAELPGQCQVIAETSGTLDIALTHKSGERLRGSADGIPSAIAAELGYALAPVRDAGARGAYEQLPQLVPLLSLLGLDSPTADRIIDRWDRNTDHLAAPIGVTSKGQFALDLPLDGPHGLIGGTTGSGKSVLLQSLLSSLAATHSPTRLNFLLVDWKGEGATMACRRLPHTVGAATNLDGSLSRVLTSLRAELNRRQLILRDAGAESLVEMAGRDPERAPASLLIVVDEFGELVKQFPDFLDGVVSVAAQGRALGMHLLLATQRPSGVINDNVRANTELRIALRVADQQDSVDVIGIPRAADIPKLLAGRALARTASNDSVTEFQSAFIRAAVEDAGQVRVHEVVLGQLDRSGRPRRARTRTAKDRSDLDRLVESCRDAHAALGLEPPPRPWLPALEGVIPLQSVEVPAEAPTSDVVVIGVRDEPQHQRQTAHLFDLEAEGSLLVYGAGGSGKTTLLRTAAVSLATRLSPRDLHLYAFDFAGRGLESLSHLPHCGGVIVGSDLERVGRLFAMLRAEIDRRVDAFAEAGVASLSEYREERPRQRMPRIVVLFDGYSKFRAAFEDSNDYDLLDGLGRLVSDGRAYGVHFLITADRRASVRNSLAGIVTRTIILKMANPDEYSALDVDLKVVRETDMLPGRGFVDGQVELQCAVVGDDAAGRSQVERVEHIGKQLRSRFKSARPPGVGVLPACVKREAMPEPAGPLQAVVGVGNSDLGPKAVNLLETHFLVVGPHRSGRTTALATLALSLHSGAPKLEMHLLAPRRSPLVSLGTWASVSRGIEACDATVNKLAARLAEREEGGEALVLVMDDGEELLESDGSSALQFIVRKGRDLNAVLIAAVESRSAHRAYGGWLVELQKEQHGLLLVPESIDGDILSAGLPRTSGRFPAGRGYLVERGAVELVQVAAD